MQKGVNQQLDEKLRGANPRSNRAELGLGQPAWADRPRAPAPLFWLCFLPLVVWCIMVLCTRAPRRPPSKFSQPLLFLAWWSPPSWSFTLCHFHASLPPMLSSISCKKSNLAAPPMLVLACAQDASMMKPSRDASWSIRDSIKLKTFPWSCLDANYSSNFEN